MTEQQVPDGAEKPEKKESFFKKNRTLLIKAFVILYLLYKAQVTFTITENERIFLYIVLLATIVNIFLRFVIDAEKFSKKFKEMAEDPASNIETSWTMLAFYSMFAILSIGLILLALISICIEIYVLINIFINILFFSSFGV